jgi:hypothetical protein
MTDRRGNQRERRERLRSLDALLLAEFESAGALCEQDLKDACSDNKELRRLEIDGETVREWWSYARRRLLIEQPVSPVLPGEFTLSAQGLTRLTQAKSSSAIASPGWERKALSRVVTFVAPSAAGIASVLALAEKNAEAFLIGVEVVAALVVGLVISWLLSSILQPLWERYIVPFSLRVNVNWLAGREMRIGFRKLDAVKPERLPNPPKP